MARLNYMAPLNSLGYGVVSWHLLRELVDQGVEIAYWPIGPVFVEPQDAPLVQQLIARQDHFDFTAACLRVWHEHSMAESIGKGPRFGFPIFELNRFTERELVHLASLDGIFVASQWAAGVVESQQEATSFGLPEVLVAPLGVDTSVFYPATSSGAGPTVFLNVGKWERRKGHDVLAGAFHRAFDRSDRVELWMMNHNPFCAQETTQYWEGLYRQGKLADKVRLLPRVGTHHEVAGIMRRADCGVFPSRAEGWNLEALEMMACGKPAILTNYSGHTEFAHRGNALLIDVDALEPAYDGVSFLGFGEWAALGDRQMEQLIEHMRAVHRRKQEGGSLSNLEGVETAQRFTWKRTATIIRERLSSDLIV